MPFLWAAYRKGAFDGVMPGEMGQDQFDERVLATVQHQLALGGEVLLMVAPMPGKEKAPVGLAQVEYRRMESWPWVTWFPWASTRNKVECSVKLVNALRKESTVMVVAQEDIQPWLRGLSRYAILRRIGRVEKYDAMNAAEIWQSIAMI